MMLVLQNISYIHPDKTPLFDHIHLSVHRCAKIGLIGNNGVGKSTLLKIMAGELVPHDGVRKVNATPYYLPQILDALNQCSVAQALRIDHKVNALQEILSGNTTNANLHALDDDWRVDERAMAALKQWGLTGLDLTHPLASLSGGQKTKVFLAGISLHTPEVILLDEPTNHLDVAGRQLLKDFIRATPATLVMISHDRELLNLVDMIYELDHHGITPYGGDYDFYATQKQIEKDALDRDIRGQEKALQKAREKERETMERQQKLDARGKKKQEKAGVAKIMMNTLRNHAERSTAKIKDSHHTKISAVAGELQKLRASLPDSGKIKFGFDDAHLHKGKVLLRAVNLNYAYHQKFLWKENLNFHITSGERVTLKGFNGSGKTTLIKLMLGALTPATGSLYSAITQAVYVDQDYTLIDQQLTVIEQAQKFNSTHLLDHEIKTRLARFLFTRDDWNKPGRVLSGGEKMRLVLCCLTIGIRAPDVLVLDEPTNNLDIQSLEILSRAIAGYEGTLIIVSHDAYFINQSQITRTITLYGEATF